MEDRSAQLLDDVLAGADELRAVLVLQRAAIASLPSEALARPRRCLVRMGSSAFAARDAAARGRHAGRDAIAEVASASGTAGPTCRDLGRSPDARRSTQIRARRRRSAG